MRVSHVELALALVLLAAPAVAQQSPGPPVRLGPPQRLNPPPATAPAPAPAAPTAAQPAKPAESPPSGIEVAPLAPVDPEWTGTLGEAQGWFSTSLWQGTPRGVVLALVPALPVTTSPTIQALERHLLLANALPPSGTEDASGFLARRAEKLLATGAVEDAAALLRVAPGRTEALERAQIELTLLAGDRDGACRLVSDAVRRQQGVWWDRALVACHALQAKHEEAALGLSLLREQKAPKDEAFDALVEAVGGRQTKLPPLTEPTPVHLALLQASKQPFPGDLGQVKAPATLRALALAEGSPLPQRLSAAQRAAAFGALTPEELRQIYEGVDFPADERANALTRAKAEKDARGRALLYSAAKAQTLPGPRAELLQALLADASLDYVVAARTIEPLLLEIAPSPEFGWFGGDAARALYAVGRPQDARAWLAVAEPEAVKALSPLIRLAEGRTAPQPEITKEKAEHAPLLLGLLDALGDDVPPDVWGPYLRAAPATAAPLPPASLWLAQTGAVEGRRIGEALLLTLPMLAEGERLTTQPIILARAIANLRGLGLEETARALAIEATLAAGF
jgi:hypothetical protein